ncbi:MAG: hypothetical protein M1834_000220 [Cirrosporium novae-zelandiae]|nr:MAG: hypothetical protein M1834_000220 [Cirrosporium novae-zelandiae]
MFGLPKDQIFEEYTIQSAVPGNAINLEVNLASLNRALRSALSATSTSIRLTKKNGIPLLSLTISTTTTSSLPSAITDDSTGHNYDGFPSQSGSIGGNTFGGVGERQTVITQDVPIVVLNPSEVDGLHEPRCREPDVNIILPNLAHLKSISDRFTRLALSTTSTASINKGSRLGNDSSGGSNPRLEISANMHGNLRLAIQTDALNIVSQWDDLINPELNPNTVGGAEAIREHPSEKMRAKTGEESFARCRIDGKDWGRVLSVGRLGGRVIACEPFQIIEYF